MSVIKVFQTAIELILYIIYNMDLIPLFQNKNDTLTLMTLMTPAN